MKDRLKKNQPVAYKILENALINENYAHAYLFVGEKGCGKLNTAYLLAQSLMCKQQGFACEECETCQRIKDNNFADMIVVDGKDVSIKKKDILQIQERFTKTAVETTNKKVYILNLIENATAEALNSLLKFLEEPTSDVIAILITEQIDKILPTIQSRCQKIPFKRLSIQDSLEYARSLDLTELDAYLCAHLVNNVDEIKILSENENYLNAKNYSLEVINNLRNNPYMVLFNLQREAFNDKKGNDKIELMYFIDILMVFFRSCILNDELCKDDSWKIAKSKYTQDQCIQLMKICMECKDQFTKSISVKLLVDSMLTKMKEVV